MPVMDPGTVSIYREQADRWVARRRALDVDEATALRAEAGPGAVISEIGRASCRERV